ncbi:reverse transcriptase domain-containing protein [Trichonephila clavipes]|nr:reverse transcriptase domain-containing protein [Trichonephila clavipes]
MVLRRLTFHLHSNNLLPEEQYGFREGHCTTDQLLYFCQNIRDAHNRKRTNHTVVIFLDLSKAFDRVWNNLLVIKLFKHFSIGGKTLPWIYDFLRNKLIRWKFNNYLSRSFSFFQGVPQGSVLSPTSFSHYLSGIESVIKRKWEVGAFADDIVLWKSDSDLMKLERDINLVLEDIRNFALDHKLSFNHTKSLRLHYKSSETRKGPSQHCSDHQLPKNTCPRDIVLFEVDLQSLSLNRRACLTKYYNKLKSLESRNLTSAYFNDWCNNQRLRRNSPFSQMVSFNLTDGAVEPN